MSSSGSLKKPFDCSEVVLEMQFAKTSSGLFVPKGALGSLNMHA